MRQSSRFPAARRWFATLLLLVSFVIASSAQACTTFVLRTDGKLYFGGNLDWPWDDGLVLINPRGVAKIGLVQQSPARWTSKYASVTFNQFGQERPFSGMNEAGLVIEEMMLPESVFPSVDARPGVDMLQWIQYQLDLCSTTVEVLATDRQVRIERPAHPARIHYLVCDAQGDCAALEFLDGKLVCHRGSELPFATLTNNTYARSAGYVESKGLPGAENRAPSGGDSLARFRCAAGRIAAFRPANPQQDVDYAFQTLHQVSQGRATVWSLVYEPRGLKIHYRTFRNPQPRTIDFASLRLAERRTTMFLDLHAPWPADGALLWQEFTEAKHRSYLQAFLGQESVKRGFADVTGMIEPNLQILRAFRYPQR